MSIQILAPFVIMSHLERANEAMRDASDALTRARIACSKSDRTELADRIIAINNAQFDLLNGNGDSVMKMMSELQSESGY